MARKLVIPLGAKWRERPAVMFIVFLVFVALLAVSVFLFVTDYITSVHGYFALPTGRVSDLEAWFVGALPQLVQVAFGFMALERRNWLFGALAGAAFVVDVGTDVTYRVTEAQQIVGQTATFMVILVALLQSVVIFTLGSEFLLVASLENIIEYMPDVLESMAFSATRLADSFTKVADTIGEDDSAPPPVARGKRSRRGGP